MIRWLRDDVAWYLTKLIMLIKILPETLIASMVYGPVPEQFGRNKFQCCTVLSNLCIAILHCYISVYLQQCLDYRFLAHHTQRCFANLIFMSLQSPRTLSPTPSAEVSLVEPVGEQYLTVIRITPAGVDFVISLIHLCLPHRHFFWISKVNKN